MITDESIYPITSKITTTNYFSVCCQRFRILVMFRKLSLEAVELRECERQLRIRTDRLSG